MHAAVAAPAYKVNSNTAIIESDDGVVIVDTHSKPSAARVIVERLRDITTKPVRYVVNTHFHWDHWHGNEVYPAAYPDAEIVTNQLTREAMVRKGLKRIQDHVRQVPAEIAQLKADLAAADGRGSARELQADLRLAESYLAEVTALKPALPTMAFERTMKLYRRDREIHLLLSRARPHRGRRVRLPAEGEGGDHRRRPDRLDALHGRRLSGGLGGDARPARRARLHPHHHGPRRLRRAASGSAPSASYVHDMVEAVREEAARGATLEEVKQRVHGRARPRLREALLRLRRLPPVARGARSPTSSAPTRW